MNLENLKSELEAAIPGCQLEIVNNPSPSAQHSLRLDHEHAVAVATYLRDAADLRFDFCSNVTGIDWPAKGTLEVVYHLFSIEKKLGPLTIRMSTIDRESGVHLPSLTPVWRSAELQEREIFDLYGVHFDGHPDLRRLLMWEGFVDHPMRRDYVDPDDYEYEPTAHDEVLRRAKQHSTDAQEREGGVR